MNRRNFIRTTGGIACAGILGTQAAGASSHGTLVNATVTGSGAIVATADDFVIAGQEITVDGSSPFYEHSGKSSVIYTDGYSGHIADNTLTVTGVAGDVFGIHARGGDVEIDDNVIDADDDVGDQFVGVAVTEGATGSVAGNEITGAHRVGVLGLGVGTDVSVQQNTITGPGPRPSGWADNGVQLSGGATGHVKDNSIDDHWYTPNTFQSSGLIAFADDVVVQRNHVTDNDVGIAFAGDRNNVIHNTVAATYTDTETDHYGVYEVGGTNNGIRQNAVTTAVASHGLVGIIVRGDNAKLIRNDLAGWAAPIQDFGEATKLPKPFEPAI